MPTHEPLPSIEATIDERGLRRCPCCGGQSLSCVVSPTWSGGTQRCYECRVCQDHFHVRIWENDDEADVAFNFPDYLGLSHSYLLRGGDVVAARYVAGGLIVTADDYEMVVSSLRQRRRSVSTN